MSTFRFEKDELSAISPDILKMYAVAAGWKKVGEYGKHCDIYDADGKPEIMIPRTDQLIDYARGVAELISFIARSAGTDEMSIYRDLTYARCDVIRARAGGGQDSLPFHAALGLMEGSKSLLTAALRSLNKSKKEHKGQVRKNAELLDKIRFGQTEKGSLVMTLLTPPIEPAHERAQAKIAAASDPIERQMTRRLMEALDAARGAVDQTAEGESGAFERAVKKGVSANLCGALVQMTKPFPELTIEATWAKTLPVKGGSSQVRFVEADVDVLSRGAAKLKQIKEAQSGTLVGFVELLERGEHAENGTVVLNMDKNEKGISSVKAVLDDDDYRRAIQAHLQKERIALTGDLKLVKNRWTLLNARC